MLGWQRDFEIRFMGAERREELLNRAREWAKEK